MYEGLTKADKPALMDAKARGFKTTKPFHQSADEWDIDLALAQIAEMESAEKPLTCNGCKRLPYKLDNYGDLRVVCYTCKRGNSDAFLDKYATEPEGERVNV